MQGLAVLLGSPELRAHMGTAARQTILGKIDAIASEAIPGHDLSPNHRMSKLAMSDPIRLVAQHLDDFAGSLVSMQPGEEPHRQMKGGLSL